MLLASSAHSPYQTYMICEYQNAPHRDAFESFLRLLTFPLRRSCGLFTSALPYEAPETSYSYFCITNLTFVTELILFEVVHAIVGSGQHGC